jgi:hypothetical protein
MGRFWIGVVAFIFALIVNGCAAKTATAKKTAYANHPTQTDTSRDVGADRLR